jgi:hypothetical protein
VIVLTSLDPPVVVGFEDSDPVGVVDESFGSFVPPQLANASKPTVKAAVTNNFLTFICFFSFLYFYKIAFK